jgi:ABC-type dipeptide/oligopeptide/nickel transport system permease component
VKLPRRYLLRRLAFVVPQLLGITLVTFLLVQLIPGDPARLMLGPLASEESIASLRDDLGLNRSLPEQYGLYVWRAAQGELGTSWRSANPVADDLARRLPATLELITLSLIFAVVIAIPLGVQAARKPGGILDRLSFGYGLVAGALPEFWLGLILILILYVNLGLTAAPSGRLDVGIPPPTQITGAYTIDSLVTGNWTAFRSAVAHLTLPVLTLVIVTIGPILKMTRSTMQQMLSADFTRYARLCGLPERLVGRYALRNALPPVVTLVAVLYSFLIGGAVLVEVVFGWGGAGQYAVQGVLDADFAVVQGFVLVAAIISLVIYLLVDLIYFAIDPRLTH